MVDAGDLKRKVSEPNKKGILVVAMCNDAFILPVKAVAAVKEITWPLMVVFPHTITGIPADQVYARVGEIVDEMFRYPTGTR